MNTRRRSMPCSTIAISIMSQIDRASPFPRSVSPGRNQLKPLLGLLEICCCGSRRTKP